MTDEPTKPANKTEGETVEAKPKSHLSRNVLLGLVTLLAVLYGGYRWAVTPHVNPNPTKKVVVHGQFPYDRGWDLQIKTSFYTKNPRCDVTARAFLIFRMADVSREAWVEIPVAREGGNSYSFTYYEDYFQPGFCEWDQRFVYSHLFQDKEWQHGNSAILGLNRQYNQINYECHYLDKLTPGMGKNTREKSVVCGDDNEKPHNFNLRRTDNEVNFAWKSKVLYEYYGSDGHRELTWKEGEEK